tara:strand:- start:1121 stop:1627 length:507 start_codon:yes stop_codon:yes gene_type:complete
MRNYPTISRGLGKFTPGLFARLMAMLREYENTGFKSDTEARGENKKKQVIMAKIVSNDDTIGGVDNRFEYKVTEQELGDFSSTSPTYDFKDKDGGFVELLAYNAVEADNQQGGEVGPGVDTGASDFPTGMSLQAVRLGTIVLCIVSRDEDGQAKGIFSIANAIDGSCT